MPVSSFEQFQQELSLLGGATLGDDSDTQELREAIGSLLRLPELDPPAIGALIQQRPNVVPVLGLIAGLTQEQLKNRLRHRFGTSGWITLARTRPNDLVAYFDEEFEIITSLASLRDQEFSYADILIERSGSRRRAGAAIRRGQALEDDVVAIVHELGLAVERGTRFIGRNYQDAPCDVAIPSGGSEALLVCAVKGFDSTGSKLSDAVREIQEMAQVRSPRQFVFAVVDGIGWLSRRSDLERIWLLKESNQIDGLYTTTMLPAFRSDLELAARRLDLL